MRQRYLGTVFSITVVPLILTRFDLTRIDILNLFVGAIFAFAFGIVLLYIEEKYF